MKNDKSALALRRQRFCEHYVRTGNATEAAIKAGYSKNTARMQGSRLLTKDDIKIQVKKLRDLQAKRTMVDADWVINKLKRNVLICLAEQNVKIHNMNTGDLEEILKHDPGGANKALELLGRHLGMFENKLKIESEEVPSFRVVIQKESEDDDDCIPD